MMGATRWKPPLMRWRWATVTDALVDYPRSVVAQKDHPCDWCVEPITKGTKHETWTWRCDGKLVHVRAHDECAVVWSEDPDQFGTGDCQRGMSHMDSEDWQWEHPICNVCGKRFAIDEDELGETCAACQKLEVGDDE